MSVGEKVLVVVGVGRRGGLEVVGVGFGSRGGLVCVGVEIVGVGKRGGLEVVGVGTGDRGGLVGVEGGVVDVGVVVGVVVLSMKVGWCCCRQKVGGRPRLHSSLSAARSSSCSKDKPWGTSMKMLPGRFMAYWTFTASLMSRLFGMRRICPSQRYLRCRISPTRSNVLVLALASTWALLPVICDRQRALHPFSMARVLSVKLHASLPYVRIEPTAARYILIFSLRGIALEPKTCLRSPHLLSARAHLLFTSCSWVPSAEKMDPRYLKLNTFFNLKPSHSTLAFAFCASITLLSRTRLSANLPLNCCAFSGLCAHQRR